MLYIFAVPEFDLKDENDGFIVFRINIYIYKFRSEDKLADFIYSIYKNVEAYKFKMNYKVILSIRESNPSDIALYFYAHFKSRSQAFKNIEKDSFVNDKNHNYCKFYYSNKILSQYLSDNKKYNLKNLQKEIDYNYTKIDRFINNMRRNLKEFYLDYINKKKKIEIKTYESIIFKDFKEIENHFDKIHYMFESETQNCIKKVLTLKFT
jgi:2C-methyl-D-erythritol 2,4-cyclodiphosphate synthase